MRRKDCRTIRAAGQLIGIAIIGFACTAAWSRDDGRYADSPLKSWFAKLKSGRGLCCSFADGVRIDDVDWDTDGPTDKNGNATYRVRLGGQWLDVPPAAVVTEPNRAGPAIVWPLMYDGKPYDIRCFLPGAGT
jgi:hypothetical protein